ncbi:MAG: hypothetical protein AAGA34_08025 [Pseudomonadota bacterium]
MFEDPFESSANSVTSPAADCFAITPDDGQDLPRATKAIYIGSGGDIVLRPVSGAEDILFANTASGSIIDVRVRAIRATGTTALDIVGLV